MPACGCSSIIKCSGRPIHLVVIFPVRKQSALISKLLISAARQHQHRAKIQLAGEGWGSLHLVARRRAEMDRMACQQFGERCYLALPTCPEF